MASRSVNRVTLLGQLGRDAETMHTSSGADITKFSIATNNRWKDRSSGEWKESTDWHSIVLFNNATIGQYLTKGKQVYIEGRLQTRSYEKEGKKMYATDVIAESVILLGGGSSSESSNVYEGEVEVPF